MKHWKGVTLPKTTILSRQGGGVSLCSWNREKLRCDGPFALWTYNCFSHQNSPISSIEKNKFFRSGSAVCVITKAYFLRRGWAISSCSSEFTVLLSLCQGNIATSSYKMKRKRCFDSVDSAWFAATCPSPTPQTHSKYQNVRCLPSNVSPWATLYLLKRLRAAKKY